MEGISFCSIEFADPRPPAALAPFPAAPCQEFNPFDGMGSAESHARRAALATADGPIQRQSFSVPPRQQQVTGVAASSWQRPSEDTGAGRSSTEWGQPDLWQQPGAARSSEGSQLLGPPGLQQGASLLASSQAASNLAVGGLAVGSLAGLRYWELASTWYHLLHVSLPHSHAISGITGTNPLENLSWMVFPDEDVGLLKLKGVDMNTDPKPWQNKFA